MSIRIFSGFRKKPRKADPKRQELFQIVTSEFLKDNQSAIQIAERIYDKVGDFMIKEYRKEIDDIEVTDPEVVTN